MPTGYTHKVAQGEMTDFPEFVMNCARAFGALVTMRDEPSDTEIPKEFEPSDYHKKAGIAAKKELNRLRCVTNAEAIKQRNKAEAERLASRAEYIKCKRDQKTRYEDMLAKVREWTPPTADHVGMKEFMIDQLSESIKFDCSPSTYQEEALPEPAIWLAEMIAAAERNVERHAKEYAAEVERTNSRNKWLSDLRTSLT